MLSGRRDLNPRPLEPHSSALPSCATARWSEYCLPVPGPRQTFRLDPMKAALLQYVHVRSVAVVILLFGISDVRAQSRKNVRLNETAFLFAAQLIRQGYVIRDHKGAWSEHRPSTDQENNFIRAHGLSEYAKWHLAIDDRYRENTKSRYKFPYGDFKNVHRCRLLAAKARARQYGYTEIENAATELERAIRGKPLTLPSR